MELLNKSFEDREEEVHRLVGEKFGFRDFESFKKDFDEKIERAHKDIEEGHCRPIEEFWTEMEAKYNINDTI